MSMMRCWSEAEIKSGLLIVRMEGRCCFSCLARFEEMLDLARLRSCSAIDVEMDRLDSIDSSGIGMLLMLREVCESSQIALTLVYPSERVRKMLAMTRLDHLFVIREDRDASRLHDEPRGEASL